MTRHGKKTHLSRTFFLVTSDKKSTSKAEIRVWSLVLGLSVGYICHVIFLKYNFPCYSTPSHIMRRCYLKYHFITTSLLSNFRITYDTSYYWIIFRVTCILLIAALGLSRRENSLILLMSVLREKLSVSPVYICVKLLCKSIRRKIFSSYNPV